MDEVADAVVIGAGFAGLSAACRLSAAGVRVLVLEALPRLGGRATAFRDPATGEAVDNGQHILLGCYRETFAFLQLVGAESNVRLQAQLEVPFVDARGRKSILRCPALPPPINLLAGILEWEALGSADRLAAMKMVRPIRLAKREARGARVKAASPGETVENWLVRNGQTARVREMLWEPLAVAALNQAVSEAAAPPFARVLARMFGSGAADAAIGLPTEPLHLAYAEPARVFIEARGGSVRRRTPATVAAGADGRAVVLVRAGRIRTAAVVVAVQWHALAGVFVPPMPALAPVIAAASATGYCPIVSVNFWFDRGLFEAPFVGLPGRRFQWLFDKRRAFGDSASHVTAVASGARSLLSSDNEDVVRAALDEIVPAIPEAASARLLRATVIREKRATFSLAPGQPSRPGVRTGVPNLFLAGDWIDTGLPATIESAVESGRRAAEAVLGLEVQPSNR
ncbi:MAG: hydroxysqualene dehydroxylase HpnE [Vicinamibacterales bacterium]